MGKNTFGSQTDIAYLLPSLALKGGVAVVLRHVYELRKRGRNASVFVFDSSTSGEWFPLISHIPCYDVRTYHTHCGPEGAAHIIATWWETAFDAVRMKAWRKHYFLQSLENRFYTRDHVFHDAFFLTLLMGLNIFTEARWIQRWLKNTIGISVPVVPNAIDHDLFYPPPVSSDQTRPLRVLIEGPSESVLKGVPDCFRAVAGLDIEVWYIAPDDSSPHPDWRIDRMFTEVPLAGMRDIYSQCDVLLKLSKVEGVFGPPLEMMACGGTCVVGDVTGHEEYCVHEQNCLVVDRNNPSDARNALKRLIGDKDLLQSLKRNGPSTAGRFSWPDSINILEREVFDTNTLKPPLDPAISQHLYGIKRHLSRSLRADSPPLRYRIVDAVWKPIQGLLRPGSRNRP